MSCWKRPWTFRAAEPAPCVSMTTGLLTAPFASLNWAFRRTVFAWDVTIGLAAPVVVVVEKLDRAKIGARSVTMPELIWYAKLSMVAVKAHALPVTPGVP